MTRVVAVLVLLATALPLGACVVDGPGGPGGGGRWCYWHPNRCAR